MRLGADVDQLEQAAQVMGQGSEATRSTMTGVGAAVQAAWWVGANADEFRSAWMRTHAPALDMVARVLEELAVELRLQATQQRDASSLAGPGGAGGGTGPSGPGGPGVPLGPVPGGGTGPSIDPGRGSGGDPVDTLTGHLYRRDVEVCLGRRPRLGSGVDAPGGLPLERWYRSGRRSAGSFGPGWWSTLDAHAIVAGDRAVVRIADGSDLTFSSVDGSWVPDAGVTAGLVVVGGRAVLADGLGVVHEFDDDGRLVALTDLRTVTPDDLLDGGGTGPHPADVTGHDLGTVAGSGGVLPRHVLLVRDGGDVTAVRSSSGTTLRLATVDGRVTAIDDDAGRRWTYGYDDGRLVEVRQPDRVGRYVLDDVGRVVEVRRDDLVLVASTYDERGRVVAQVDVDGGSWSFAYDRDPDVTTITRPDGAVVAHTHRDGRLVEVAGPEGVRRAERGPDGAIVAVSTDRGRLEQDGPGHPTDTTRIDEVGVDGERRRVVSGDAEALVVVGDGSRLDVSSDADRGRAVLAEDGRRLEVAVTRTDEGTEVDVGGAAVRVVVDDRGRVRTVDDAGGHAEWLRDGDDLQGVRHRAWTGLATSVTLAPPADADQRDDEVEVVAEVARDDHPIGRIGLDGAGQRRWSTTPDGRHWGWDHDVLDRVVAATGPGDRRATWQWGLHGVERRRGPDGDLQVRHDERGRVVGTTTPHGHESSWELDEAGRVVAITTGAGRVTVARDPAGRVADVRGGGVDATFHRRPDGLLVSVEDAGGTVRWDHDEDGRVTAIDRRGGLPVAIERDGSGQVRAVAIDGRRMEVPGVGPAALGRHDGPGGVVGLGRDGATGTATTPIGLRLVDEYDARGVVVSRRADLDGDVVFDESVTRNDAVQLAATTTTHGRQEVVRDARGWVTGGGPTGARRTYAYDDAGRRTSWSTPAGRLAATFDDRGRLAAVDGPDGRRALDHDAAGRVVADGDWSFTHDAAGGLVEATDGTTTVRHDLDSASRRVRSVTTRDGAVVRDLRWTWDLTRPRPRVVAVHDAVRGRTEVVRHDHVGRPLAIVDLDDERRSRWLVTDHLGSVRVVVGHDGRILRRRDFGPFGEVVADTGREDGLLHLGFVGSVEDPETGHLHLQARQYDPSLGRFQSPDPTQAPVGSLPVDGYAYCHNQPTEYHDPTGAWPGWVESAAETVGDGLEAVGDAAVAVGSAATDAVGDIPVVGDALETAVDWTWEHRAEIAMVAAAAGMVVGTVATGGALAVVATGLTYTAVGLSGASALQNMSERDWDAAALDAVGAYLGAGSAGSTGLLRLGGTGRFGTYVDDVFRGMDPAWTTHASRVLASHVMTPAGFLAGAWSMGVDDVPSPAM